MSFPSDRVNAALSAVRRPLFEAGATIEESFDSYDSQNAEIFLWQFRVIKLRRDSAFGSFAGCHTASLQLARIDWGGGILRRCVAPPRTITFRATARGDVPTVCGVTMPRQAIWVRHSESAGEVFSDGPSRIVHASMAADEFERKARVLLADGEFSADSVEQAYRCEEFRLNKLLTFLGRAFELGLRQPALLKNADAAGFLEDELASLLVSNMARPMRADSPRIRHRAARRAMEFIEEEGCEAISIRQICEAIGASQRTLELGFRELYGASPKQYLTLFRLERAHRDLTQAGAASSVTEIATKWGFFHFGRFSGIYMNRFGQAPSQTLRGRFGAARANSAIGQARGVLAGAGD